MSSSRPSFNGASAEAGSENVAKRTANRKGITLIGRRREGGQVFGGDQWSLFGDSGLAQAVENTLKSGQIRRVVAHRLPSGVSARDDEGRVEGETGLDCGMRLVESVKLSQGGGQEKV